MPVPIHPIKVGLIFLGAACTSLFFGLKILRHGLAGLRSGRYPLSADRDLEGASARIVASLIALFGTLTFICGVVTLVFGYFRLRQMIG